MESHMCPACERGKAGLIVQFPDSHTRGGLERTMGDHLEKEWQRLDEVTIWFSLALALDSVPYWEEFHQPSSWGFQHAGRTPGGDISPGERLTWNEFRLMNQSLWVEEIVRENRLRMMAQPIVDVVRQKTIGFELLARALTEEGDIISPAELYKAAREQSQLFRLDRACRIRGIETGQSFPSDRFMFINFIPTSIYLPEHCLATTIAAVERCGIDRSRVVFEVVETDEVQDLMHLKRILEYYQKQGFRTALDDVGSGFNNLEVLRVLEPDIVKLDRQFVSGIHESDEKQARALSILEAGRAVGAQMLAEGIEDPLESRLLAQMGYHLQQGYFFGRPGWDAADVPRDKFTTVQGS